MHMRRSHAISLAIAAGCILALLPAARQARKRGLPPHPSKISFESLDWQVPLGTPYRHELDGGLVVYIAEDRSLPRVTLNAEIRYGSICDPAGKEGLGDMMARLMRTGGTELLTADSLDMLLDLHAINVSFAQHDSRLSMSASFLSEHLDTALTLIGQMLFEPAFEQSRVDEERDVFMERIRHRFDNPGPLAVAAHAKAMYAGEENSRLATEASLKSITRDDLVALHKRVLVRRNIIFGAAGDFDAGTLRSRIDKLFPPMPADSTPVAFPEIGFERPHRALVVHKPITQAYVRMSLPMFARPHPDYYPASVLNHVLGGGSFSSRLNQSVRSDAGLTYSIYSSVVSNYTYPGTFYIHFHTKTETTDDAIALVLAELRKIRESGITQEELTNAKSELIDQLPSMFRSQGDIVSHYTWNEYYGRSPDHYRVYAEKLQAITLDDVRGMARKYLDPDSLTFVVVSDTSVVFSDDAREKFSLRDLSPAVVPADSVAQLP
ncbi:MAG: hypothetical protein GF331_05090 [Chitinivibrionales bacterium]|nr:hypothetical protein [Chitinivibrionales bacterium]